MESISLFLEKLLNESIVKSIITILISFLIYKGISYIFLKGKDSKKLNISNKSKTYLRMLKSVLRYVFLAITVLIVLQINGVNVSSMLAGVGILGIILGFAIQDVLKDIIKGFDILSDQYFQVGDIIKYNGIEAKVLIIGLKTTKVQDVRTFNIISIANRNIEQVEVLSNAIIIQVPMPYEISVEKAEQAIGTIIEKVSKLENVDGCSYKGVNELAESSINYQLDVRCKPELKVQMRRNVLRCVLLGLAENNIEVPYKQIDIHQK